MKKNKYILLCALLLTSCSNNDTPSSKENIISYEDENITIKTNEIKEFDFHTLILLCVRFSRLWPLITRTKHGKITKKLPLSEKFSPPLAFF